MLGKSLCVAGALAFAAVGMAQAKSYEMVFTVPVQAGSLELQPGAYSISRHGDNAVFTKVASGETFTVPVTVQYMDGRNQTENVMIGHKNGQAYIESVQLGGRHTTLEFAE